MNRELSWVCLSDIAFTCVYKYQSNIPSRARTHVFPDFIFAGYFLQNDNRNHFWSLIQSGLCLYYYIVSEKDYEFNVDSYQRGFCRRYLLMGLRGNKKRVQSCTVCKQ